MGRITIRRNEFGGVSVIGDVPEDNGFYYFALGKVLSGEYTEISWIPISYGIPKKENITHQSQQTMIK